MEPVLVIIAAIALAWGTQRFLRARQRRRIAQTPLSDEDKRILDQNIPLYRKLPDELKEKLERQIQTFLFDKRFHGLQGLEIDDEIRLTVAGTACILLLGRSDLEFANFTTILIYPSTFVSEQRIQDGLLEEVGRPARLGESWKRGPLVLAWDSARHGVGDIKDGHNVILHEFAHKLDEADGAMDGTPILEQTSQYLSWARVMQSAFEDLQNSAAADIQTVMDHYGATNAAEFFAVLVETFYEKPRQLSKHHPELYAQMRRCLGVNPIEWHDPARND